MTRTFEIKLTITIPEKVANEKDFQDFKNDILSGKSQRDWLGGKLGITKCTITLTEIKKQ
jgi:hypothetical protein